MRLAAGVSVPESALEFTFVSSSGPGGQNVNRRSTKARLRVRVEDLPLRPAAERRLRTLAGSLITDEGDLVIVCDTTRSQRANREECLDRLKELVARSLVAPKPRKKTKPTRGSVERRLKEKRIRSERKTRRKSDDDG
ncbi:MAG: aminoacyl-tRNA hydrolase [Phycisphaera sp.]|nr:aminoacyl-tRNA hydrolase [Phycisphaera sp.]